MPKKTPKLSKQDRADQERLKYLSKNLLDLTELEIEEWVLLRKKFYKKSAPRKTSDISGRRPRDILDLEKDRIRHRARYAHDPEHRKQKILSVKKYNTSSQINPKGQAYKHYYYTKMKEEFKASITVYRDEQGVLVEGVSLLNLVKLSPFVNWNHYSGKGLLPLPTRVGHVVLFDGGSGREAKYFTVEEARKILKALVYFVTKKHKVSSSQRDVFLKKLVWTAYSNAHK